MTLTAEARRFAATLCPLPLTGVTGEELDEAIDAWLANEFAGADHQHIHNINEDDIQ